MSDRPNQVDAIPFVLSRGELRVLVRALARSRRGVSPMLESARREWETLAGLQRRAEEALREALQDGGSAD